MAISILCPECRVQLGLPDEAAGANVGCPRCGARMIVPRPSAPAPSTPPPPPQTHEEPKQQPRRLERDDEVDGDEEVVERTRRRTPSSDRPRRKRKKDDNSGIWIGVGIGAGVLVAVAILAVFLAQPPEKKTSSDPPATVTIVPYGVDPNGPGNNATGGPIAGPGGNTFTPTRPTRPPGWADFIHPEEGFICYIPGPAFPAPIGDRSLRLGQPLGPGQERTSIYQVASNANQPMACMMSVTVYGPNKPARPYDLMSRPADTPDMRVTEFQIVTWGGRQASEGAGIRTMRFNGDNPPPKTSYMISRVQDLPDRLYMFSMEREDRMPNATERAAFFDSFVPGK
jgi:DNA-directed RNA polymerase subunit RPC12/RpoP